MSARRFSTLAVVLVAAMMLAIGSLGTATAGGLTTKTVKKIAAKVVAQKQSGLSVDTAKTADSAKTAGSATTATTAGSAQNADKLGGLPPSAYQQTATLYSYPVLFPQTSLNVTLPLAAPGSYQVSVTASFQRTSPGAADTATCWIARISSGRYYYAADQTQYAAAGLQPAVTAAGSMTLVAGDTVKLSCFLASGGSFTTVANSAASEPVQVTVTPLATLTVGVPAG
jgi:hypothetical protein